ncbi:ATP-binding cassette, subfamily F, uup [Parapedobacter luteus]|uniref:ATP-binding cassette, subfamily F, uup n=1 Tax=Parapedobacter luteus TaxID=623280 RepID=A0A1T5CWU6_9SPHI|nr:ABC-F family ATP-binding cassette domain-containing protein [Parapedobacter luteus]SKB63998.1 ATP-binding cassette, subfamily F, uup [Parapedobacter luteus]
MSILSTERLGHSYHDMWLFRNLHFGLQRGDRVALVGANGAGKSSLLRILAGALDPTEGTVVKEKGIRIGFLPQDPDLSVYASINDFIYSADNEQQRLIRRYEELVASPQADAHQLMVLSDQLSALNAWEYEHTIKSILSRLQITDFSREVAKLSGGQRKRLSLAKLLIDEPDVYILDEPTNHLDIETIEWLEKLLTTGQKTVLLVTHDRYFLDAVSIGIRELDHGKLTAYTGNYSYYLEKKAEQEEAAGVLLDRNRNLLRKELEWMRRQPQARGTKSKARIDAFHELEEKTKGQKQNDTVQLSVKISRQGNKILELESISKGYDEQTLISDFSYVFKKGDRVGLAGRNGTGKSTFLNLITGLEQPDSGTVTKGGTTVFGYYKQGGLVPSSETERVIDVVKNVAEYISMANGDTLSASQLLTQFLFPPEKQFNMVSKLSGGERKRLQLLRVLMQNPNFLILDEPANDLDIDTLNVLEEFLVNYPGVLLMVSHDRYLLDRLTDQLFIFEGNGTVTVYNGNYADYKSEQAILVQRAKTAVEQKAPPKTDKTPVKKKLSYTELKEYESLDSEIPLLEQRIAERTSALNETNDYTAIAEIASEIEQLNNDLDLKTARWLDLGEYI